MNDSVIVLGGTGFIGSALIKQLISCGFKNVASVSLKKSTKITGVIDIKADILDYGQLENVCKPYHTIINCTGQITTPINSCLQQNSIGITNIINVVKKSKKQLIHLSTVSIYGTSVRVDENSDLNPETSYSTAKYFAEFLLRQNINKDLLKIIRLGNIYGIGCKGILNYLLSSFLEDKELYFNNNGDLTRFYMHVDDCACNIVKLIDSKKIFDVINLVSEEKFSIKDLLEIVRLKTNYSFKVKYEDKFPYENINEISIDKIKSIMKLNFEKNISSYIESNFIRKNEEKK